MQQAPNSQQSAIATTQPQPHIPKTFDFVIVLCPNIGLGSEFEAYAADGLYIGGHTRMQAAADLYRSDISVKKFIVVGGGLEQTDAALRWKKTEHMRDFLVKQGVPETDIWRVASQSDTSGNFRAIWTTCHQQLRGKVIGVLTNQYHLARAMRIASDPQFDWGNAQLIPLAAESFVADKTDLPLPSATPVANRVAREQQGLRDWQQNTYRNQHLPRSQWQGLINRATPPYAAAEPA